MNELNKEIEKIEQVLAQPEKLGTETEIYSRVSGYMRNVKNWNSGKQAEFHDRKVYIIDR